MKTLWHNCVKVDEAVKLPFGLVSGVSLGIDLHDTVITVFTVLGGGRDHHGDWEVLGVFLIHRFGNWEDNVASSKLLWDFCNGLLCHKAAITKTQSLQCYTLT